MYDYTNARKEMMVSDQASGAIASPSIEAGQNEVKVDVTLTYEVK